MGRSNRLVAITAFAAVAAASTVGLPGAEARPASSSHTTSGTFTAPVYAGDFPDPSVVTVGGTYWAYATGSGGSNLQVMSSSDLHTWSAPTDPLPTLPSWASAGSTWAPGVAVLGGQYVLYYTVHDTGLKMQCLSVATSSTPQGPFSDKSSGPLECQTADGGSIDPNPYVDPGTGAAYLVWKSDDNALGQRTHLWAEQLAPGGLAFAAGTAPSLLLTESAAWQAPSVEGPDLVRTATGYVLFYGANAWNSSSSGIGYATSPSLLGAYTNQSVKGPWVGSTGAAAGPQGPAVFTDATGATRMAFAAWDGTVGYANGGVRSLWVGTLGFSRSGVPQLG
ncbi:MAG TPA: glycoside hydrolase family 43 protein [Acidimicrobiales bacterium]|nr:glycoside hydrolase family 43 protein [Acidimicrobiales bacterium]